MRHEADFPATRSSVPSARRFVADTLTGVPDEVSDAAALIASELATNSVRHAASAFRVRIERLPDRVQIEVEDDGDGEPVVGSPGPADASGRGLQIIDALADSWGVIPKPEAIGKTVWVTISLRDDSPSGPGHLDVSDPAHRHKSTGRGTGSSGSRPRIVPVWDDRVAEVTAPGLWADTRCAARRTEPDRRCPRLGARAPATGVPRFSD
jgi:anti-sigma regulatory factor (Ser/Thr protein kinase)